MKEIIKREILFAKTKSEEAGNKIDEIIRTGKIPFEFNKWEFETMEAANFWWWHALRLENLLKETEE